MMSIFNKKNIYIFLKKIEQSREMNTICFHEKSVTEFIFISFIDERGYLIMSTADIITVISIGSLNNQSYVIVSSNYWFYNYCIIKVLLIAISGYIGSLFDLSHPIPTIWCCKFWLDFRAKIEDGQYPYWHTMWQNKMW